MDSFSWGRVFLEAVGAVAAAGLAAPSPAQMVGLGEDYVWAVVIELAGFGRGRDAGFRSGRLRGHASIFADGGLQRDCGSILARLRRLKLKHE